ncbi:MAG: adenylyl-sulfate kinase, partial [Oscillospiraceae bacterium]
AIGSAMMSLLQRRSAGWVFLDGDFVRTLFGEDLGHTVQARLANAERIVRLCQGFEATGMNVLACVLSIFPDMLRQNRTAFEDYREVYIKADMATLLRRDNKGLYQKAQAGALRDVVGVDIPFPEPECPDIVFDNSADGGLLAEKAIGLIRQLGIALDEAYPYTRRDRIDQPFRYEYTPFEGTFFLDGYAAEREKGRAVLRRRLGDAPGPETGAGLWRLVDSLGEKCGARAGGESPGQLSFCALVFPLAQAVLHGGLTDGGRERLFQFIKKFEVSKRLYAAYDAQSLKPLGDFGETAPYAVFACLLGRYARSEAALPQKTIAFNALLKINDTLMSVLYRMGSAAELALALDALQAEAALYTFYKELNA